MSTPQSPGHTRTYDWLVRHSKSTFVLMSTAFVMFGGLSVNLVSHFFANANYLLTYQWEALIDGGLLQLVELLVKAIVALGSYLLFKLCEHALIERLAHPLVQSKAPLPTNVQMDPKGPGARKSARFQVQKKVEK